MDWNAALKQTALAGGGGSSSGGFSGDGYSGGYGGTSNSGLADNTSNTSGTGIYVVVIVLVVIAIAVVVRRIAKKSDFNSSPAPSTTALQGLKSSDPSWNATESIAYAQDIFVRYQNDWSTFNLVSMKQYMTPHYYRHAELMMQALQQVNRKNEVKNVVVKSAVLTSVKDTDIGAAYFTASLRASATDSIIDTISNTSLFSQNITADESYRFEKNLNGTWVVAGIDESTASESMRSATLRNFASQHGFFYSLDWGWLLLPRRGQLFAEGAFGISDINNHVIGAVNNQVIQIYTYSPRPGTTKDQYVIAQVALPKSYGEIFVRTKKSRTKVRELKSIPLTGLKTEWQAFNDKYEVYASDIERVTSFELLQPTFMEQLEALPYDICIEVVDTIAYLYSEQAIDYEAMLTLLGHVFNEMKM